MTMLVYVGSKSQPSVVVSVPGTGIDQNEARRAGVQFARARHRISDPIALSEHEAAIRLRRQFVAQFAPKMPNLNNGVPFWQQPDRTAQFYRN